jgi:hypothetical protein
VGSFLFISVVILSMIFFVNCIAIAKKIKRGQKTALNTVAGAIMIGFIVYVSIMLAAS